MTNALHRHIGIDQVPERSKTFPRLTVEEKLLIERGKFIMRGVGETMPQDGVRETLAV